MADTERAGARRGLAVPLTAFAAGAVVALLVGVFGRVHDPSTTNGVTTFSASTPSSTSKVGGLTVIGVLAVLQVIGALWIYGKLRDRGTVLARHGATASPGPSPSC